MGIYKSIEAAKNGMMIPVFHNGRTMESRYNPVRDAENLCNTISSVSNFFLVVGIGSGFFIAKLSEKFPSTRIIGIEIFDEDVTFLRQLESIKNLENNSNIILTSLNNLQDCLLQNYRIFNNKELIDQYKKIEKFIDLIFFTDRRTGKDKHGLVVSFELKGAYNEADFYDMNIFTHLLIAR